MTAKKHQMRERLYRYALRKTSCGVGSVAIAIFAVGLLPTAVTVQANELEEPVLTSSLPAVSTASEVATGDELGDQGKEVLTVEDSLATSGGNLQGNQTGLTGEEEPPVSPEISMSPAAPTTRSATESTPATTLQLRNVARKITPTSNSKTLIESSLSTIPSVQIANPQKATDGGRTNSSSDENNTKIIAGRETGSGDNGYNNWESVYLQYDLGKVHPIEAINIYRNTYANAISTFKNVKVEVSTSPDFTEDVHVLFAEGDVVETADTKGAPQILRPAQPIPAQYVRVWGRGHYIQNTNSSWAGYSNGVLINELEVMAKVEVTEDTDSQAVNLAKLKAPYVYGLDPTNLAAINDGKFDENYAIHNTVGNSYLQYEFKRAYNLQSIRYKLQPGVYRVTSVALDGNPYPNDEQEIFRRQQVTVDENTIFEVALPDGTQSQYVRFRAQRADGRPVGYSEIEILGTGDSYDEAMEPYVAPASRFNKLVWSDEFDGDAVDESKWQIIDGMVNHAAIYNRDAVSIKKDGDKSYLSIRSKNYASTQDLIDAVGIDRYDDKALASKITWSSGRVESKDKYSFQYGRMAVRAKSNDSKGIWPAIWMLAQDETGHDEIDVLEYLGQTPWQAWTTNHFGILAKNKESHGVPIESYEAWSQNFHVYEVEWNPTNIKWFIDGRHVFTSERGRDDGRDGMHSRPMFPILETQVGDGWVGDVDYSRNETKQDSEYLIDWIRVYQEEGQDQVYFDNLDDHSSSDSYYIRPKEKLGKLISVSDGTAPHENKNHFYYGGQPRYETSRLYAGDNQQENALVYELHNPSAVHLTTYYKTLEDYKVYNGHAWADEGKSIRKHLVGSESIDFKVFSSIDGQAWKAETVSVVDNFVEATPAYARTTFDVKQLSDGARFVKIVFPTVQGRQYSLMNGQRRDILSHDVQLAKVTFTAPEAAVSVTPPTRPTAPTNLALNRPATASGVEVGTNTTPSQAFDDNANSRWAGLPMKQSTRPEEQQTPQWLQVDLGASASLTGLELDFYRKVYATDYTVLTSATGEEGSWRQVHQSTNLVADANTLDPTDRISFTSPLEVDRHLRFQFNRINHFAGGNSVSVKDVRVLGHLTQTPTTPIDPVAKINAASLGIVGDRVVLVNAPEDDQYTYEVIGSANEYVVDNQGKLSSYRLNDLDVVMVVAARRKDNQELVIPSKVNKTVHVPASHRERVQGTNTKPQLALEIQEFLPGQGVLTIGREATVHFADGSDKQAALFNKDLQGVLGYQLQAAAADQATISFKLTDDYDLKDEGYLMRIGDKVEVFANDAKAFNYAAVTIAQMLQAQGHLTKGVYRDYPNYAIRGMLLDVARIPMRQDFLEEVSHLFRWYKLNELHLHINDNQWPDGDRGSVAPWSKTEAAHRLESTAFPTLNKMDFKHDRYEGEYDFYRQVYGNPAYSLDDFKTFQTNNTAAGINTLVEIDTPGHSAVYSLYALKNPDNVDYLGRPIHHPRDLEALAINPETYPEETARAKRFVRELLKGYLDAGVFTYDQIHLGVDEYWQKNGNLEAFRTYLNELNDLAKEHGKTLRTWGALSMFPGNTPVSKDIIFDEWAQYESVTIDRINEGFKVVNVPQPFTYVTPGRNHKDIINEQYVFDHWKPYIFNLDVAADKRQALDGEPLLLGAKGAMWGDEHYEGIEESDLYYRLEKSLAMIGFKTWNDKSDRNFVDYQKAFEATRLRNNYLPYETKTEVVVNLEAAYASDNQVTDLSTNGLIIRSEGQTEVVELDGDKWLKFDGTNHLVTELETLSLPYTLEMTFRPTNVDKGTLLLSEDGALFLNGKGRNQAGDVLEGFGLNRYFYSQYLAPKLESGKDYKLTLTGTREVLNVYLNDQRVASLTHVEGSTVGTRGNFRTSFNLPLKAIGQGFEGYIKNLKVYNRTQEAAEIGKENLERVNLALHKPVYDYRHQSAFWNQHIKPYHRGRLTDGDVDGAEGRWNSSNHDRDYFIVDLEQGQTFNAVQVIFDQARPATAFKVLISDDLATFREVAVVADNSRADVTLDLGNQSARYVKFESVARKQGTNEVAVKEFRVYQTRTDDKSLLAQRFAQKEIAPDQEAWLTVNNVLANKFATAQDIQEALALLANLADKAIPQPLPEVPKDLVATRPTHGSLTLTWTASEGADSYVVEQAGADGQFVVLGQSLGTSLNVYNLAPEQAYQFRVRAVNATGESANTAVLTAETVAKDVTQKLPVVGKIASTPDQPGEGLERFFDGDEGTIYHSQWGKSDAVPSSLTIDLGEAKQLDHLIYVPRPAASNGTITGLTVETSLDGTTWTPTGETIRWDRNNLDKIALFPDGTTARHIRINWASSVGGFVSGQELYVIERAETETPVDPTDPTSPTNPVDPTDPTSPTNPVDPTDPTSPTNPVDPTDPTSPTNPVDPTDPTSPTNPVDPTDPTSPTNPVDPTDPTSPTNPVDPTDPTSPTNPVDPTDPTSPTNPVDPTDPTSPTNPVDPTDPTSPTNPVDPTDPTSPTNPVDPTDPTSPTNPVDPTDPTSPTNPVDPTDPTSPTNPVDPTDPSTPTGPVDPTDPSTPTGPVDPTDPSTPTGPVDPTDPSTPTGPVDPTDPSTPTGPVDPTDPTSPVDPSDSTDPTSPVDPTVPVTTPATPARVFEDQATGVIVKLAAGEDSNIVAIQIVHKETRDLATPTVLTGKDYDLYDIELVDKDGKVIKTKFSAVVELPVDAGKDVAEVIYLPNSDQSESLFFRQVERTEAGEVKRYVVFTAEHFSEYGIVYKPTATVPVPAPAGTDALTVSSTDKAPVAATPTSSSTAQPSLPSTGEEGSSLALLGGAALVAALGLVGVRKRQD